MNKSVIALLAASAFGTAFADTSLTPYILVDVGASSTTTTGKNGTGLVFKDSVSRASKFGLKADADLGNGLKGFLVIEEGISPNGNDSGGLNGVTNRVGKVGITGSFGTVAIGNQWGPYDNSTGYGDAQDYNRFSAYATMLNSGAHWDGGNGTPSGSTRGSIQYTSPSMNGFTFEANYAPEKVNGNANNLSSYGFDVVYMGGPLMVTAAIDHTPTRYSNVGWGSSSLGYANAWKVEGAYDFGPASLTAAFIGAKVNETALGSDRDSGYSLGVKVPRGKWTFALGAGSVKTSGDDMNQTTSSLGAQAHFAYNKNLTFYVGARTDKTSPVTGVSSTTNKFGAGLVAAF